MLVLLVIVLTTATFVAKGMIPIDLCEVKSSSKLINTKKLTITLKENNTIYFDDKIITKDNIENKLYSFKSTIPIVLNCDKNIKFENFIYIVNILKEKNYTNLNIVTRYE